MDVFLNKMRGKKLLLRPIIPQIVPKSRQIVENMGRNIDEIV
jgi:hypothetical protein